LKELRIEAHFNDMDRYWEFLPNNASDIHGNVVDSHAIGIS